MSQFSTLVNLAKAYGPDNLPKVRKIVKDALVCLEAIAAQNQDHPRASTLAHYVDETRRDLSAVDAAILETAGRAIKKSKSSATT
jgi:hypothetical protein